MPQALVPIYEKILRFDALPKWREDAGYHVVATNGCFDILHRGHVEYLCKAKALGDKLVVGVNSDQSVRQLKGDSRPINNHQDRAFVLASLQPVDYVVVFDGTRATDFLDAVKPNVWAKGGDYTLDSLDKDEVKTVLKNEGSIEIIPMSQGYSTTSILQKV